MKTNISDINDSDVSNLLYFNSKKYNMKTCVNDTFSSKIKFGIIAQEAQEQLPNLVNEDNTTLSVDYNQLSGLVPYLYQKINNLDERLKVLENQ